MPQLYMVTVPGLDVRSDWARVHDRLLDDFPYVADVLPTTIAATVLIVYRGSAQIDAWFQRIAEVIAAAESRPGGGARRLGGAGLS